MFWLSFNLLLQMRYGIPMSTYFEKLLSSTNYLNYRTWKTDFVNYFALVNTVDVSRYQTSTVFIVKFSAFLPSNSFCSRHLSEQRPNVGRNNATSCRANNVLKGSPLSVRRLAKHYQRKYTNNCLFETSAAQLTARCYARIKKNGEYLHRPASHLRQIKWLACHKLVPLETFGVEAGTTYFS